MIIPHTADSLLWRVKAWTYPKAVRDLSPNCHVSKWTGNVQNGCKYIWYDVFAELNPFVFIFVPLWHSETLTSCSWKTRNIYNEVSTVGRKDLVSQISAKIIMTLFCPELSGRRAALLYSIWPNGYGPGSCQCVHLILYPYTHVYLTVSLNLTICVKGTTGKCLSNGIREQFNGKKFFC